MESAGAGGSSSWEVLETAAVGSIPPALSAPTDIDADDWQTLATPLIEPILNRAANDPHALLADLATAYPDLAAEDLTAPSRSGAGGAARRGVFPGCSPCVRAAAFARATPELFAGCG